MNQRLSILLIAAIAAATFGCTNELTDDAAPVALIVTNTQILNRIDLAGGQGCDQNVGTINLQVIPKSGAATGNFVQVRVQRYRVSYQRTDGGRQVPRSFVRSIDALVGVGETSQINQFVIVEGDALTQAPFAALLPNNGGRDPETGRPVVKMDVIVEIFGETLGGDDVYDVTRFPLDFCYQCNGCA